VLLVHQPKTDTTTAFVAQASGQRLTFAAANADATTLTDKETGSRWSPYGECTAGKLKGSKLEMLVLEPEYWFAWSEFHRETTIYTPPRP
jgi:predicted secreted protein